MSGNPKDRIGASKLPLHLFPASAVAMGAVGMANGAMKYGRNNFRAERVRASIYAAAAQRHLHAWLEGEEVDPDDGVPHLGAVLANIAILVEAQTHGTLLDDRNPGSPAAYRQLIDRLTPLIGELQQKHAGRNPVHHTRAEDAA